MTHPSRKTRILATCPTGPGSDLLGGFQFTGMQTVDPPGDHLTIATSMYHEMHRRFQLEQAEEEPEHLGGAYGV